MIEQNGVGVVLRCDVDAPHDLDEPAGLRAIPGAVFVDGIADEVQHFCLSTILDQRK